jgi:hypothetical protein
MTTKKYLLSAVLLTLAMVLFTPNSLKAQKQKYPAAKSLLRKEFHPEEGFVNLRAIQLGKEGVLLTSETYKIEKGESRFHYDIVNTDLQIVKENVLSVDRMVIGTGMTQKAFLGKVNYHHLFYGRKNFILHTIPRSGLEEGTVVEGSFPVEGIIESVSALPDKMVLILRAKSAISLMYIDWKTGDTHVTPIQLPEGVKTNKAMVLSFQELPNINEFAVIVRMDEKSGYHSQCLMYTTDGDLARTIEITPKQDIVLIECKVSAIDKTKFIFSGTYNNRLQNKKSLLADGFFFAESDARSLRFLTPTNFLDLENFTSYLSDRQQEYIDKRVERAESAGKELTLECLMTIHPIAALSDGYMLVGEVFYPTYTNQSVYVNGKMESRNVFDGYKYTHSVVVKFDVNGNRKMDQCLPLKLNNKPKEIVKVVSMNTSVPNQVSLSYVSDNILTYKLFNQSGTEISQKKCEIVVTGREDERLISTTANMRHWYDANFIISGYQTTKDQDGETTKVFYLNKVQLTE